MESLLIFILITALIVGFLFIKKQIDKKSEDNTKEIESKLESFIEEFKLTSAQNLSKHLQDSKLDQKNMEVRFSDTINKLTK